MFAGTHTALVTPFRNGTIDQTAFKQLIDQQAEAGISGIVPVGTTGESATLTKSEHLDVIRMAVDFNAGRMQVIAGTGANSTSEAIRLTTEAEKIGATASLQVCPYYNKPSQEGLYQHYKAIADSTALPIVLYSIPGRSVIEISEATTARLASDCENINAIKEAGGRPERVDFLRQALPDDFEILSGDDPLTYEFMTRGACGVISVAANLIPKIMVELVQHFSENRRQEALAIHEKYLPFLTDLMSLETNPVPIKTAIGLTGLCEISFRLPLVPLNDQQLSSLKKSLTQFDIL